MLALCHDHGPAAYVLSAAKGAVCADQGVLNHYPMLLLIAMVPLAHLCNWHGIPHFYVGGNPGLSLNICHYLEGYL